MKKTLLFFLFAAVFFGACQDVKQPERPENLIPKEKMVDILTEAYLNNAARSIDNKTILENGIQMDSILFKNFGIDSLQLVKSNAYYAADVNAYMEIFQKVEAKLNAMQKETDSIREKQWLHNDSIKRQSEKANPPSETPRDSLI
ncbi:DUF4296 domain-containing protein [Vitellibacter sp. q18]|nr:DUF4296 domain-containing protein [Aequorivita lutea]